MSDSQTTELQDAVLLERFLQSGDQVAFALLVHRYHGLVLGVCQRTLSNRHDAEDAFQATFVLLATKGHAIRRRSSVASWLYGAAHRISLRIRRKRKTAQMDAIKEHPMVPGDQHWQKVAEQDCLRHLDAELARLPSSLREPMILRYLRGLNNESVASQLGTTVAAIEGRLKRAKSQLRMRLLRHGITLSVAATALLRNQRSARAVDVSHLIERTIEQALTVSSGSAGTEEVSLATRLAKEEALSMQLIRWSKIAVVGMALAGSVGIPISMRTLVGQGLAAPGSTGAGASTVTVDSSGASAEPKAPEDLTVRVIQSGASTSSPDNNPFGAAGGGSSDGSGGGGGGPTVSGDADPFTATGTAAAGSGGGMAATTSRFQTGQGNRFDIVDSPNVARIEEALLAPGQVEFVDAPLSEAVEQLQQRFGIAIGVDVAAMEEAGITTDARVNGSYSDISLRSILHHLLRPLQLTYVIRDEILLITTQEELEQSVEVRVYRIEKPNNATVSLTKFAEMLPNLIEPDSWTEQGGETFCTTYDDKLVVRSSPDVHDQINDLLRKLGYIATK